MTFLYTNKKNVKKEIKKTNPIYNNNRILDAYLRSGTLDEISKCGVRRREPST